MLAADLTNSLLRRVERWHFFHFILNMVEETHTIIEPFAQPYKMYTWCQPFVRLKPFSVSYSRWEISRIPPIRLKRSNPTLWNVMIVVHLFYFSFMKQRFVYFYNGSMLAIVHFKQWIRWLKSSILSLPILWWEWDPLNRHYCISAKWPPPATFWL